MKRVYEANDPTAVTAAVTTLREGGIILYPTDTIYGLGLNAHNPAALARLYALKGRPDGKPVSVLIPNLEVAATLGTLSDDAQLLAKTFLPGPLTLVLPLRTETALATSREQTTVGIRIVNHPFCKQLTAAANFPITATSANRSGEPTATTVADILAQFGAAANDIDLIIDGGTLASGTPSTVVDTTVVPPALLRAGALPWGEVLRVLQKARSAPMMSSTVC
jgi:L-threonylcarbamoyladenylate synthase